MRQCWVLSFLHTKLVRRNVHELHICRPRKFALFGAPHCRRWPAALRLSLPASSLLPWLQAFYTLVQDPNSAVRNHSSVHCHLAPMCEVVYFSISKGQDAMPHRSALLDDCAISVTIAALSAKAIVRRAHAVHHNRILCEAELQSLPSSSTKNAGWPQPPANAHQLDSR